MSDETPRTARGMLALIALAETVPLPKAVNFWVNEPEFSNTHVLRLALRTLADAAAWADHFGVKHHTNTHSEKVWFRHDHPTWQGWKVQLSADEPVPVAPDPDIDDATRAGLIELAYGPVEPAGDVTEYTAPGGALSVEHPA